MLLAPSNTQDYFSPERQRGKLDFLGRYAGDINNLESRMMRNTSVLLLAAGVAACAPTPTVTAPRESPLI
jgi:hypothetical protein